MKTISVLRKEVLRDHLTKEIKENEAKLYELSNQLIKPSVERESHVAPNDNCEQKIAPESDQTQILMQVSILKDNISVLQTKLNIVERNILKSN